MRLPPDLTFDVSTTRVDPSHRPRLHRPAVEEAIHLTQVQEEEAVVAAPQVQHRLAEDLLVGEAVVRVHPVRYLLTGQLVEDREAAGDPVGSVDVTLLDEIEAGQQARVDADLEQRTEPEQATADLRDGATRHPMVEHAVGHEREMP